MPTSQARSNAHAHECAPDSRSKFEGQDTRMRAEAPRAGCIGDQVDAADSAEVDRLAHAFVSELGAEGEMGRTLARRLAVMAVRMEQSALEESASAAARVRKARDEAEIPEGADDKTAERLRDEAGRIALFDPSKEACLARKHEAASERSFFRALKELRQLRKDRAAEAVVATAPAAEVAAQARASLSRLGSALQTPRTPAARPNPPTPPIVPPLVPSLLDAPTPGRAGGQSSPSDYFDIPIAIGRRR